MEVVIVISVVVVAAAAARWSLLLSSCCCLNVVMEAKVSLAIMTMEMEAVTQFSAVLPRVLTVSPSNHSRPHPHN